MEILEEREVPVTDRLMPILSFTSKYSAVRLLKKTLAISGDCSYEIVVKVTYKEPAKLSLWEHLKLKWQRKPWPMTEVTTWMPVRSFLDEDPADPYMENCAREVFDYLTKDYETDI